MKKDSLFATQCLRVFQTAAKATPVFLIGLGLIAPELAGASEEAPPGLVELNRSLFFQIANFLLIMIALNYWLYRPIRKIIKERKEKFSTFEKDIANLTGKVEETQKEIERQLLETRRNGFLKKDEIKTEGMEREKDILAVATSEAEARIQSIKDQIAGEIIQARDKLKADLDAFSREVAQKVLGRSLT